METTPVRESIRKSVESVLWLDRVTAEDEEYQHTLSQLGDTRRERCMICTLPVGTCEHSSDWIFQRELQRYTEESENDVFKSELDREIDAALDVLGEDDRESASLLQQLKERETQSDLAEVDLLNLRWAKLNELHTDKIGSSPFSLFVPDERLWHSSVCVEDEFLLVFGGFKYKGKDPFRPFHSLIDPSDIEFLSDLRVYHVPSRAWFGLKGQGLSLPVNTSMTKPAAREFVTKFPSPCARYGHCAAALSGKRMFLYGGRAAMGAILSDVWVYSLQSDLWEELSSASVALSAALPAPRFFSSACSDPTDSHAVLIFGGTNGVDNFGDLWKFSASPPEEVSNNEEDDNVSEDVREFREEQKRKLREKIISDDPQTNCWSRCFAVGLPPSPRYGHSLLALSQGTEGRRDRVRTTTSSDRRENALCVVLGGCAVSPQSEVVGSAFSAEETLSLMTVSAALQRSLQGESETAILGRDALEAAIDGRSESLRDVIRRGERLRSTLQFKERETRRAEQFMVDSYKTAQANVQMNIKRARHPIPFLDLHILSLPVSSHSEREGERLREKEMISWIQPEKQYPKLSGTKPRARVFFGSACMGARYVLVCGGAHPTSLTLSPVENTKEQQAESAELFVFDVHTNRWLKPLPINSRDYLRESVKQAEAEVIRCRAKRDAEKMRAMSLGAPGGKTKELIIADSQLNVAQWRRDALQRESKLAALSPLPSFGSSLTTIRQRALLLGGLGREKDRDCHRRGVLVLEMENEKEKERRLQEELDARLERERFEAESKQIMDTLVSAHELKEIALRERLAMERELMLMSIQDALSSLPPLSLPPAPSLVKANQHTIWLQWPRVRKDTQGNIVDRDKVVYFLYVESSFQNFLVGDRVLVIEKDKKIEPTEGSGESEKSQAPTDAQLVLYFSPAVRRFPGEITRCGAAGRFDVLFDDGTVEKDIPRWRLAMDRDRSHSQFARLSASTAYPFGDGRDEEHSFSRPSSSSSTFSFKSETSPSRPLSVSLSHGESVESLQAMLSSSNAFSQSVRKRLQSKLSQRVHQREKVQKFLTSSIAHKAMPMVAERPESKQSTMDTTDARYNQAIPHWPEEHFYNDSLHFTGSSSFPTSSLPSATPQPTVMPGAPWRLVYSGRDSHYALSGLVPRAVLERERHCRVAVRVALQTFGLDYPAYERSQLSRPVVFFTTTAPAVMEVDQKTEHTDTNAKRNDKKEVAVPQEEDLDEEREQGHEEEEDEEVQPTMSRTRKQLISAVIQGHTVHIEQRNHLFIAEGRGEDFL